jgi:hypothetical protein
VYIDERFTWSCGSGSAAETDKMVEARVCCGDEVLAVLYMDKNMGKAIYCNVYVRTGDTADG